MTINPNLGDPNPGERRPEIHPASMADTFSALSIDFDVNGYPRREYEEPEEHIIRMAGMLLEILRGDSEGGSSAVDTTSQNTTHPQESAIQLVVLPASEQQPIEEASLAEAPVDTVKESDIDLPGLGLLALQAPDAPHDHDLYKRYSAELPVLAPHSELQAYLNQVNTIPKLKDGEDIQLGKDIKSGVLAQERLSTAMDLDEELTQELVALVRQGEQAQEILIATHLRLAYSIAKQRFGAANAGMSSMDIISAANMGLLKAVERYDYTKGVKFATFATFWVKKERNYGIRQSGGAVYIPKKPLELIRQIKEFRRQQESTNSSLGVQEIMQEFGITEEKAQELIQLERGVVSLDTPVSEDGSASLGDLYESESDINVADAAINSVDYERLLDTIRFILDERQAAVFIAVYRDEMSLKDISSIMGISYQRVSQLKQQAHDNLAKALPSLIDFRR